MMLSAAVPVDDDYEPPAPLPRPPTPPHTIPPPIVRPPVSAQSAAAVAAPQSVPLPRHTEQEMARIAEITRRLQSCAQGEPAAVAAPQVRHTDSELAAMSNAFVAQRVTVQQPQPKPRQDPPTPFDAHQQRVALAAASERQISTNAAIARAQLREIERWKESPDNPANAETVPVMQARIKQLEAQVADYKTRCLPVGLDARSMSQIIARAEALLAAQKK